MAREERDIYNLDEDGLREEETDAAEDDEEFEDHVVYHDFYGY